MYLGGVPHSEVTEDNDDVVADGRVLRSLQLSHHLQDGGLGQVFLLQTQLAWRERSEGGEVRGRRGQREERSEGGEKFSRSQTIANHLFRDSLGWLVGIHREVSSIPTRSSATPSLEAEPKPTDLLASSFV